MTNIPEDGPIPNWTDTVHSERVELEKVYLYINSRISELMLDYPGLSQNAKILPIIKTISDGMVMQMTSWCATGRIPDSVVTETVTWPDGVWQTFKEKFMPEWFLNKFPVRNVEKIIETTHNVYFVCPHINVPDNRPHIQFMVTGTKMGERMNRL